MPKNIKGGNKSKRGKNHVFHVKTLLKSDSIGSQYAVIDKVLGNCRYLLILLDSKEQKQGIMRGHLKKVQCTKGDIVLVGIRDFQDNVVDIVCKYTTEQVNELKFKKEINNNIVTNNNIDNDDDIIFDYTLEKEINSSDDMSIDNDGIIKNPNR